MGNYKGIVHDLPEDEYHAHSALSSTGVKLLLPEYKGSPKKFLYHQTHRRESRAFDLGHAVHAKVLGVGAGVIPFPAEHLTPSGNVSTKAATVEWATEQRANGLVPVSPNEIAWVNDMAEAVLTHPTAAPLFEVAVHREVSLFTDIDGVPLRARFDALSDETRNGTYGVDLKSTDDATPNGFTRSIHRFGYDVQEALYDEIHKTITGREVNQFWFVAVEKNPPHEVGVHRLEEQWVAMGRTKTARARELFREATETGVWRGYDPAPNTLAPPAYAVIEHELEYEYGEMNI